MTRSTINALIITMWMGVVLVLVAVTLTPFPH